MVPMVMTPNLLTPEDLSGLLKVPVDTLRHWRYHRTGPPWLKIGGRVRYTVPAVTEWLAAQQVVTA